MFTSDAVESARCRNELDVYLSAAVDDGKTLVCPAALAVNGQPGCHDVQPANRRLAGGQLSYVGRNYALTMKGRPFRILVVGMQTGEAGNHVTMTDRSDQVARASRHEPGYYTTHMAGTAAALAELFGTGGEESVTVDGVRRHVFECFSLVNASLCSSTARRNAEYAHHTQREKQLRSGSPANIMYVNCRSHLREAIRILRPTVVLCEGRTMGAGQTPSTSVRAVVDDWQAVDPGTVYDARLDGHDFVAVTVRHPSARGRWKWGSSAAPEFCREVQPALVKARRHAGFL